MQGQHNINSTYILGEGGVTQGLCNESDAAVHCVAGKLQSLQVVQRWHTGACSSQASCLVHSHSSSGVDVTVTASSTQDTGLAVESAEASCLTPAVDQTIAAYREQTLGRALA